MQENKEKSGKLMALFLLGTLLISSIIVITLPEEDRQKVREIIFKKGKG